MTTTNDSANNGYTVSFNGTNIPQIENFTPPEFSQETYVASYYGDSFERQSPTLVKATSLTLTVGFDASQHGFLLTALLAKTVAPIVVACLPSSGSSATAQTFTNASGFVSSYKVLGGSAKDQSKLEIKLSGSGAWTAS